MHGMNHNKELATLLHTNDESMQWYFHDIQFS